MFAASHNLFHGDTVLLLMESYTRSSLAGPLDLLNVLSLTQPVKLSILSTSLDPVSTATSNPLSSLSLTSQSLVPTHTFSSPPKEPIDVLFVPGGLGARSDLSELSKFLLDKIDESKYVLTVCTGSAILARTGLLDSHRATSNKKAFKWVQSVGVKVDWVKKARWVVDDKFWTSSGVAAGMDMFCGWIEVVYGREFAEGTAKYIEYDWKRDADWDPFSEMYD